MKIIGAILLLFIFSFTGMVKIGQVFSYFSNYSIYKNVLCVNQDIETLNCNGQCQLSKEFEKIDERNSSPINPLKIETFAFLPFISSPCSSEKHLVSNLNQKSQFPVVQLTYSSIVKETSTPPPQYFIFS